MSGNCDYSSLMPEKLICIICAMQWKHSIQSATLRHGTVRYPTHNALRSASKLVRSGNDSPSPFGRRSQSRFRSDRDQPVLGPLIAHIRPRWSCGTARRHRSVGRCTRWTGHKIKRGSAYARKYVYERGDVHRWRWGGSEQGNAGCGDPGVAAPFCIYAMGYPVVTRTLDSILGGEMKGEEGERKNDAQKVGRKTNLDACPPCQHDLLRLLVQICPVSQPLR